MEHIRRRQLYAALLDSDGEPEPEEASSRRALNIQSEDGNSTGDQHSGQVDVHVQVAHANPAMHLKWGPKGGSPSVYGTLRSHTGHLLLPHSAAHVPPTRRATQAKNLQSSPHHDADSPKRSSLPTHCKAMATDRATEDGQVIVACASFFGAARSMVSQLKKVSSSAFAGRELDRNSGRGGAQLRDSSEARGRSTRTGTERGIG